MLIVTAANEPYYPGVFALWRSIQENSPNHQLTALIYGSPDSRARMQAECLEVGIDALNGPPVDCPVLAKGAHENNDPMYIRLELPWLFEDPRILWMDCDQIVTAPLDELDTIDLRGHPCGMVDTQLGIKYQMKSNPNVDEFSNRRAGFGGLILIEADTWNEEEITEKCYAMMQNRKDIEFTFVVQSVLNVVLDGNFCPLPACYQRFGNRDVIPDDAKVIHWHGRPSSPWMKMRPVKNTALWERYANPSYGR